MKNLALLGAAAGGVLLIFCLMSPGCLGPNPKPCSEPLIFNKPARVGVVAFGNNSGVYGSGWDTKEYIATMITTGLGGKRDFRIFERQQLSKVIAEQKLNPLQNPETAVKIGNLTGIQLLVVGTITSINQQRVPTPAGKAGGMMVTVDFKAIDAETGEIKINGRASDFALGVVLENGLRLPSAGKRAFRKVGNKVADKLAKCVEVA